MMSSTKTLRFTLGLFAVLAIGVPGSARAVVTPPGPLYSTLTAPRLAQGFTVGSYDGAAFSFQTTATGYVIDTVKVQLKNNDAASGQIDVAIYDASGASGAPGTIVGTAVGTVPAGTLTSTYQTFTFSSLNRTLAPSTNYWVVISSTGLSSVSPFDPDSPASASVARTNDTFGEVTTGSNGSSTLCTAALNCAAPPLGWSTPSTSYYVIGAVIPASPTPTPTPPPATPTPGPTATPTPPPATPTPPPATPTPPPATPTPPPATPTPPPATPTPPPGPTPTPAPPTPTPFVVADSFVQLNDRLDTPPADTFTIRARVEVAPGSDPVSDGVANGASAAALQTGSAGGAFTGYAEVDSFTWDPAQCKAVTNGRSLYCKDEASGSFLRLRGSSGKPGSFRILAIVKRRDFIPGKPFVTPLAGQTVIGEFNWLIETSTGLCEVTHNGERTTCRLKR